MPTIHGAVLAGVYLLLFLCLFATVFFLIKSVSRERLRIRLIRVRPTRMVLRWFADKRKGAGYYARKRLLEGCGLAWPIQTYTALRTIGMLLCGSLLIISCLAWKYGWMQGLFSPIWILAAGLLGLCAGLFDKALLQSYRKNRMHRIVKELYVISHHLLYYSGSELNIHTKLTRCLPYAGTIRNELQLLLNDWYYDADAALHRFKLKLGTDDGRRFAETIHSIRLYDNERYYELLRQRIQDYKEKLELHRESRKEMNSYVLFMLAGIPIFNTFRLFIYPWVSEGQKLFESLN